MIRSLISDTARAQVTLEMIIVVTIVVMFVSFMLKFVLWEMKEMNERVRAYSNARNVGICGLGICGSNMKFLNVNLYPGSSLYSYYKKSEP